MDRPQADEHVEERLATLEQALAAANEEIERLRGDMMRYRTAFRKSQDVLFVVDSATRKILEVSDGVLFALGFSPRELIGKPFSQLVPEDEDQIKEERLTHVHTFDAVFVDQSIRHFDGRTILVDFTITLIPWPTRQAILITLRPSEERHRNNYEREQLLAELKSALAQVKTLRGILPICAHCKRVRDDDGYWSQVEEYIRAHSAVNFSHSICPECYGEHYTF